MIRGNGPVIRPLGAHGITGTWAGLTASYDQASGLHLAHLGCQHVKKSTKRLADLPESLRAYCDRKYGQAWKRSQPATQMVASAVASGVSAAGLQGAVLVDTMRGGSDYWRPGKLLTDVADLLRDLEIAYAREDVLCPTRELLSRFREDENMSFAMYAANYAAELSASGELGLRVAAFVAVSAHSRGLLPVYYCTDPYLPGYGTPLSNDATQFGERRYEEDDGGYLRERGCHRVVLVECLARFLDSQGCTVTVHELDANIGESYERAW